MHSTSSDRQNTELTGVSGVKTNSRKIAMNDKMANFLSRVSLI